jgi:hypothetical protein
VCSLLFFIAFRIFLLSILWNSIWNQSRYLVLVVVETHAHQVFVKTLECIFWKENFNNEHQVFDLCPKQVLPFAWAEIFLS